jgi:hypothetical protein
VVSSMGIMVQVGDMSLMSRSCLHHKPGKRGVGRVGAKSR